MSRSASNATGQLVEKAWAPVKSVVRDGASVCMGEPPGGGHIAGSGASAEVGGAASRPGPQQQARPSSCCSPLRAHSHLPGSWSNLPGSFGERCQ